MKRDDRAGSERAGHPPDPQLTGGIGQAWRLGFRVEGGIFATNSLAGQTTTVLHELAHTLGLIPNDQGNPDQSFTNTNTIVENCALAILAAISGGN